jgi:hypothetical protein
MIRDLIKLRMLVKSQHMKHYPKEKVTDHEADRIIEAMSEQAQTQLIKLAVDYGISEL